MVNISLDVRFLAVIVTPNPCPRHVCLMSVTIYQQKKSMLMIIADRMLLIGNNFANEGF